MKPILLLLFLTLSCHAESPQRTKEDLEAQEAHWRAMAKPQVEVWTNANPPKAAFGTNRMRIAGQFHWPTNPSGFLVLSNILSWTNKSPHYPITYQTNYPAQVTVELVTNVWSYDNGVYIDNESPWGGSTRIMIEGGVMSLKKPKAADERWEVTDVIERTSIAFKIHSKRNTVTDYEYDVRDDRIVSSTTNHFVLKSEWTKQ